MINEAKPISVRKQCGLLDILRSGVGSGIVLTDRAKTIGYRVASKPKTTIRLLPQTTARKR